MGELLGALGLAWPRLLLYPGGIFALVAAKLLGVWLQPRGKRSASLPTEQIDIIYSITPLVVLTLLPLAPARSFPYGLDLVTAVMLLEWPRVLQVASKAGNDPNMGALRSGIVHDYLPLVGGGALMAMAVGGLELTRLLRFPEGLLDQGFLAAGTLLWLAALPRLIDAGPRSIAGELRMLGLALIAALPLLGALATWTGGVLPPGIAGWVLPPAAIGSVATTLGLLARVRST